MSKDTTAFATFEAGKTIDPEAKTKSDQTCEGIDGKNSPTTKFCSSKEQKAAALKLSANDDIIYEYYCCKEKCVSASVFETFCCDPKDAGSCRRKQLSARKDAEFIRVLRTRDSITGKDQHHQQQQVSNATAVPQNVV